MGNYTGVATKLRVRKDVHPQALAFIDYVFDQPGADEGIGAAAKMGMEEITQQVQDIQSMLSGSSDVFETWDWQVKEDRGDHWLYEGRASAKHVDLDLLQLMIESMKPELILAEGDVLVRTIYDDFDYERIICVENGTLSQKVGLEYAVEWDSESSYSHPRSYMREGEATSESRGELTRTDRHHEDVVLPWSLSEIEAAKGVNLKSGSTSTSALRLGPR